MIELEIKDGSVKLGDLSSPDTNVKFFTKNLMFVRQGTTVLMEFIKAVLTYEQFRDACAVASEAGSPKLWHKTFYKEVTRVMGRTPRVAIKLWNAAEFYTKIAPRQDLVDALARRHKGRVNARVFKDIVHNEELFQQILDDDLKNILPLVFYFKETPKTLRQKLGKGLWKRLAAQTFHRNNLIARNIASIMGGVEVYWDQEGGFWEKTKKLLLLMEKLPSTLLANKSYMHYWKSYREHPEYDYVTEKFREIIPMTQINHATLMLMLQKTRRIQDTARMAAQLEEKFDMRKYDLDSFEILHDKFTEMINERQYSKEIIACLDRIEPKSIEFGDYEIKILQSRYDIHVEGKELRHCVAGYGAAVAQGQYLVCSITCKGKKVSTLGLTRGMRDRTVMDEPIRLTEEQIANRELHFGFKILPTWDFQQHYGFANGRGEGQAHLGGGIQSMFQVFLADLMISRLNGDDYVSDVDLEELEYHYNQVLQGNFSPNFYIGNFPVDRMKINPYNPASYKSPFDSRFKKMVTYEPQGDVRALMA